ncbi:MAG: acyltransferase family protein [Clostridiales bacterium]|nr:acyltransferase family protein [Clostridiales bacterium]
MRKYYIDNLRILCILLLFPFHTAMIYNNYGEQFYIHGKDSVIASLFTIAVYPWWMSLLFALAGISTVYAMNHRTTNEYIKERVHKLLIPVLSGIVLLIPIQTYIADLYFRQYEGSYLEHIPIFLKLTDFSGYDGHFTPGHTWFILYLFVISIITLPLILWYKKRVKKINGEKIRMSALIFMFLIVLVSTPILEIGGKSIGEFTACFLLGYFVLSLEEVQNKLEKNYGFLGVFWVVLILIRCILYQNGMSDGIIWNIEYRILSWIGILAALGIAKHFLNGNYSFTKYFTPAAFPIYLFHQSILVVVGYFILRFIEIFWLQYWCIVLFTFILTLLVYEVCKRLPVLRFLFGMKKVDKRS